MPLETATYVSDLVATNPQSSDQQNQGDDHIRLLKSTLQSTFPNITGALTATHTALNSIAGWLTAGASVLADAGAYFAAEATTGIRKVSAGVLALRILGTDRFTVSASGVSVTGDASVSGNATVSGNVTLSTAPSASAHATTKNYVDTADALKVDKTTTVSAGAGLTGGGALSANISLAIASTSNGYGTRTVSSSAPSGGSDGDVWYKI